VHYDYPARKAKILFEHTKRVKVSRYDEVRVNDQWSGRLAPVG
jgi:hypothetical protein